MELKISSDDHIGTVQMIGQFWEQKDLIVFQEKIDDMILKGHKWIVVDMSRLSYISSQGLGLVVKMFSKMRDIEGQLILLSPLGNVKDVIELAGFRSFMKIFESDKEMQKFLASAG
jgi:anti-anti-sigma factor